MPEDPHSAGYYFGALLGVLMVMVALAVLVRAY